MHHASKKQILEQEPIQNTQKDPLNINIKKMQNKILCQNSKLRTIHPSRRRIFALKAKVQRCPNGTPYTCSCDGEGANVRRRDDEAQRKYKGAKGKARYYSRSFAFANSHSRSRKIILTPLFVLCVSSSSPLKK